MVQTKTIVHCGASHGERNEALFRQLLAESDPLEIRTLYLTAGRFRRDQLTERFLEAFPAVFETPILTLDDLTRTLLRAAPMAAHRIAETEKLGLLEEILESGRHRLGDEAFRAGALPHVSRYVAFVKGQNIFDADLLRLRYQKFRRAPSPLERELIEVFAEYQALLDARGLEDREGERARLYTGLLTGAVDPRNVYPGLRRVIVEGIYRLTLLEAGILNLLRESLREMVVSIGGLESPEWDPLRPEWRFLAVPEPEWVVHPPAGACPRRRLVRPSNREEEVVYAARELSRLKRLRPGMSWSSAALVSNRPDAYLPAVDAIFGDFGIPSFPVTGRSVRESAAAATVLQYLRALEDDFSSDTLFDLLAGGHVEARDCPTEDLLALEPWARRFGGTLGVAFWQRDFPRWIGEICGRNRKSKPGFGDRLEAAADALAKLVGGLELSLDPPRPLDRWRRDVAARLIPHWTSPTVQGREATMENLLLRDLWRDLGAAALAQGPDRQCSIQSFRSLVERHLARTRCRPDAGGDAVILASPAHVQQADFDHLFWFGLAEGEFPDNPTQHIFFDDVRSSQWGFFGWRDRLDESRWLFRLLSGSVRESLHLSCPLRIGDAPALPSSLLRELALTEAETEAAPEAFAGLKLPLDPAALENVQRAARVQRLRETGTGSSFHGFFEQAEALRRLRRTLFAGEVAVTPTQLENYVRCGYRFLLRKAMGLSPPQPESLDLTPGERGDLIHAVLFRFMDEGFEPPGGNGEAARQSWTRHQRARMHRILLEELDRLRPESRRREDLFARHELERLAAGLPDGEGRGVLAEFIDQQWRWLRKMQVEALESDVGPVELGTISDPLEGRLAPVRLRGKIDRIDSAADGLFLIDYKTGVDRSHRVYDGWGFQLPLYVWMAGRWLRRPVSGAGFYILRPPGDVRLKKLRARDGENAEQGLRRLAEYYRDKALQAVGGLYRGRFPVTLLSRDKAGCPTCEFRRVCRYDAAHADRLRAEGGLPSEERIIEHGRWLPREPEAAPGSGRGGAF